MANTIGGAAGTLTTSGDTVVLGITGDAYATVIWTVSTAGTSAISTEYSKDGGTNWLVAPYSVNISATSANPSTAPWSNNGAVAGTYETPLPGNCTHFRIKCATTGTASAVSISGGKPYVPGVPVVAVLWDATSAVNTSNNTGVLDVSGWSALWSGYNSGGASNVTLGIYEVDDAGSDFSSGAVGPSAGLGGYYMVGGGLSVGSNSAGWNMPRRLRVSLGAVAAQQTRLRVIARR